MTYKYSRKEIAKQLKLICTEVWIRLCLLAKKEDKKKEGFGCCKHKWMKYENGKGYYCYWCEKEKDISSTPLTLGGSPYPLDFFEEIEEIADDGFKTARINALIRNQKKLYQYIKEKI